MQANVRHFPCLASLCKATSDPQCVAALASVSCTPEGPRYDLKLAFTSMEHRGGLANVPRHPEICLCLPLPPGLLPLLVTGKAQFLGIRRMRSLDLL